LHLQIILGSGRSSR